jgi:excinuclease ABC subunit C
MKSQYVNKLKLPEVPGVYIFRDSHGKPAYIGRATSLRDRVNSYFSNDLIKTRGPRIVDMVTKSTRLTYEKTDSVLEAIIRESNLIKKYQPKYNVDERDDKSSLYIVVTNEKWPRVFTVRARDFDKIGILASDASSIDGQIKAKKIFGPYPHGGLMNDALKILRKLFPFKDKKSHDPRHEAFYRAIGRSPKSESELAQRQYLRTINNLATFLSGNKTTLIKRLTNEMKTYARNMEFEQAGKIKRTIYGLKHINDIALIKKRAEDYNADSIGENHGSTIGDARAGGFRIEAYDIAHLSGTNVVGAMVVFVNGERASKEYRTFKISRDMNNDIANLVELISRRLNHSEWTYPDLIIVDGNENQKKAAEAVLSARRIDIPVVAITKDERHKACEIIGNFDNAGEIGGKKRSGDLLKRNILAANMEAHRFVLRYHRRRRKLL